MMIVRSLSVTCVAARRAFLVLLALVVLVAFGASGREWTSCGLGVLELWPSVGCLSPSLTYRFLPLRLIRRLPNLLPPTSLSITLSIAYLPRVFSRAHLSLFQRFLDHLKAHDEYFTVTIRLN